MSKFGKIDQSTIGSHTRAEWDEQVKAQGFLCFYCGVPICEKSLDPNCELTKDHLVAVSRGGVDFIWNIVAACAACNRMKGVQLPGLFIRRIAQAVISEAQNSKGTYLYKGSFLGGDTTVAGDIPVAIPFHKARDGREEDGYGNRTEDHLLVSQFAAQSIAYLVDRKSMGDSNTYYQKRRQLLRDQAIQIERLGREASGQLTLPIFGEGQSRKLMETEPAAMVVANGMHVSEPMGRKA